MATKETGWRRVCSAAAVVGTFLVAHAPLAPAQVEPAAQYTVRRIWDEAPHNAFTDLIRSGDRFYCTFREGTGHVPRERSDDGKIRVIASDDAQDWRSLALLEKNGADLRDPKLSRMPDGRLMLLMGGSRYEDGQLVGYSPHVSFSDTAGNEFAPPLPVMLDEQVATGKDWLWRVTWHNGVAYGVVYQSADGETAVHLVRSDDGIQFRAVTDLELDGNPNEATIRFRGDGEMLMVVRREAGNGRGMFGHSVPPYTDWMWHEMTHRLGGPNFVILPDGALILGTRKYAPGGAKTIIGSLADDGAVNELIDLPSGGDTSYPGMLVHNRQLYVSYYSSHEDKTAIYLAEIPLDALR